MFIFFALAEKIKCSNQLGLIICSEHDFLSDENVSKNFTFKSSSKWWLSEIVMTVSGLSCLISYKRLEIHVCHLLSLMRGKNCDWLCSHCKTQIVERTSFSYCTNSACLCSTSSCSLSIVCGKISLLRQEYVSSIIHFCTNLHTLSWTVIRFCWVCVVSCLIVDAPRWMLARYTSASVVLSHIFSNNFTTFLFSDIM